MKKQIVFLIFGLVAAAQAQDLNVPIKFHGEGQIFYELAHKPTSVQGQSRFDFGLLQISPELKIDDSLSAHFRFVLTEERSAVTNKKNYVTELQNAYFKYQDSRMPNWQHEAGLVRPLWHRQNLQVNRFEIFGPASWSMARRYKIVSEGDLGYQGSWRPSETWTFAFNWLNGEENKTDEVGPNKEGYLQAYYTRPTLTIMAAFGYGKVDRLDADISVKQRALFSIEKIWGRFGLHLEGFLAQDPSVDLEANERFEKIMFTELTTPKRIQTSGGRAEAFYNLSDKQALLLRYDYLRPQWSRKRVESFQVAALQKESERLSWGGFYEKNHYGPQHSSRSKVDEFVRLGAQVSF